jgi:hypothetical protein
VGSQTPPGKNRTRERPASAPRTGELTPEGPRALVGSGFPQGNATRRRASFGTGWKHQVGWVARLIRVGRKGDRRCWKQGRTGLARGPQDRTKWFVFSRRQHVRTTSRVPRCSQVGRKAWPQRMSAGSKGCASDRKSCPKRRMKRLRRNQGGVGSTRSSVQLPLHVDPTVEKRQAEPTVGPDSKQQSPAKRKLRGD